MPVRPTGARISGSRGGLAENRGREIALRHIDQDALAELDLLAGRRDWRAAFPRHRSRDRRNRRTPWARCACGSCRRSSMQVMCFMNVPGPSCICRFEVSSSMLGPTAKSLRGTGAAASQERLHDRTTLRPQRRQRRRESAGSMRPWRRGWRRPFRAPTRSTSPSRRPRKRDHHVRRKD